MQKNRKINLVRDLIKEKQHKNALPRTYILKLCETSLNIIKTRFPYIISDNIDLEIFSKNIFLLAPSEFDQIYDNIGKKENWDKRFSGVFATYRIYGKEGICLIRAAPEGIDFIRDNLSYLEFYYLHAISHEILESLQNFFYTEDYINENLVNLIDEIRNYIVSESLQTLSKKKLKYFPLLVHTSTYANILGLVNILGEKRVTSLIKNPLSDKILLDILMKKIGKDDFNRLIINWNKDNMLLAHLILVKNTFNKINALKS